MGFLQKMFGGGGQPRVSATEAHELMDSGAILLDVREPHEWKAGHAPKARHIPMRDVPRRAKELRKDRQVLVICRTGSRSRSVVRQLAADGFDVHDVAGGMNSWARSGLPVVGSGGRPGVIA